MVPLQAVLLLYSLFPLWLVHPVDIYEPTSIPAAEYYALQDLYNSTGGDNWLWGDIALRGPHWFDDSPDPCSTPMWQGLNCSCVTDKRSLEKSCHVIEVVLDNYRVRGVLPKSLTYLTEVTTLSFSHNELNGTIPELVSNFSHLIELNLGSNSFTGSFPEFLGKLVSIEIMTSLIVLFYSVGDSAGDSHFIGK